MAHDVVTENADPVLLTSSNTTSNLPAVMLEANANGIWTLNPLNIDNKVKGDGLDRGDQFISGSGGLILEC